VRIGRSPPTLTPEPLCGVEGLHRIPGILWWCAGCCCVMVCRSSADEISAVVICLLLRPLWQVSWRRRRRFFIALVRCALGVRRSFAKTAAFVRRKHTVSIVTCSIVTGKSARPTRHRKTERIVRGFLFSVFVSGTPVQHSIRNSCCYTGLAFLL
jgi:hypothetical protein